MMNEPATDETTSETTMNGAATQTMTAVVRDAYGGPDVLRLDQIDRPVPGAGEVLIRVEASTVQPFEWHNMTGEPWLVRLQGGLRRPTSPLLGTDVAGTVAEVGPDVTSVSVGDRVWGFGRGTLAEFAIAGAGTVRALPEELSFEQGAAIGVAAITALQALERGGATAESSVLVIGASGGVGTHAVQMAADLGAHVTGVCSTRNVDLVASLGADEVVDYTTTDLASIERRFDVIVDNQGSLTPAQIKRLLVDDGRWIIVGGPKSGRVFGPMAHMARGLASFALSKKSAKPFIASVNTESVAALAELVDRGVVEPVIGHRFELADVADALRLVGDGHARGKVVITV